MKGRYGKQNFNDIRCLRSILKMKKRQEEVAREEGVSCLTLQRWAARYKKDGLAGLDRDSCSDSTFVL